MTGAKRREAQTPLRALAEASGYVGVQSYIDGVLLAQELDAVVGPPIDHLFDAIPVTEDVGTTGRDLLRVALTSRTLESGKEYVTFLQKLGELDIYPMVKKLVPLLGLGEDHTSMVITPTNDSAGFVAFGAWDFPMWQLQRGAEPSFYGKGRDSVDWSMPLLHRDKAWRLYLKQLSNVVDALADVLPNPRLVLDEYTDIDKSFYTFKIETDLVGFGRDFIQYQRKKCVVKSPRPVQRKENRIQMPPEAVDALSGEPHRGRAQVSEPTRAGLSPLPQVRRRQGI